MKTPSLTPQRTTFQGGLADLARTSATATAFEFKRIADATRTKNQLVMGYIIEDTRGNRILVSAVYTHPLRGYPGEA